MIGFLKIGAALEKISCSANDILYFFLERRGVTQVV